MASLATALRVQAMMGAAREQRRRPPRKWPRPQWPTKQRLEYYRVLLAMVGDVQAVVRRELLPLLPSLLAAHNITRPEPEPVRYDAQARVPAGSPEGGQFTSTGGSGGAAPGAAHAWPSEGVEKMQLATTHGELHMAAHLMPAARTAFFVQQGHAPEAVAKADQLLQDYGGNQSQQHHAMAAIDAHLGARDGVAGALHAASDLEQQAFQVWQGGGTQRAARLETDIQKAQRDWEGDRGEREIMAREHDAEDFSQVASGMRRQSQRQEEAMQTVYRGGTAGERTVESWTIHSGGARTQHHGSGAGSRIAVTNKATIPELNARGYRLLGGIVRSMGAPGEGERTFIRFPSGATRKDATGTLTDEAFERLREEAQRAVPERRIEMAAQQNALRVSKWHGEQLQKQIQHVAKINLFEDQSGLAEHLEVFVADNVALVKSLAFGQLDDLKGIVLRGARQGLHHSVVADQIEQRFAVPKKRAALIATDQIGKLNGELNQLRQQNLGVRRYRWSSSQDERVRPRHRTLNGTIQEWTKPPVTDERTGERAHPGQPIRCRCQPIPIIDDVLVEAGLMDPEDVELGQPSSGPQPVLRRVPVPQPPPANVPSPAELAAAAAAKEAKRAAAAARKAARDLAAGEARAAAAKAALEAQRAAASAAARASARAAASAAALPSARLGEIGERVFGRKLTDAEIDDLVGLRAELPPGHSLVASVQEYVNQINERVKITGGIIDKDKNLVGSFSRVYTRENGQTNVHHQAFFIGEEYQGSGIGGQLFNAQIDAYVKHGIARVSLEAAEVGKYVWTKAGFEWTDPKQYERLFSALRKHLDGKFGAERATKLLAKVQKPEDIARLVVDKERVGKDFLLKSERFGPLSRHIEMAQTPAKLKRL